MSAKRVIDDHLELANIGTKTHAQLETHLAGIGNYAFPAADGAVDEFIKTDGAGNLSWATAGGGFACDDLNSCQLSDLGTRPHSQLTGIGASDHHTDHQAASVEDADFKSVNIADGQAYKQNTKNILKAKSTGNIFIGEGAGKDTIQNYNIFAGHLSGYKNTSGKDNTFIGYITGYNNTSGYRNTFIGASAGFNSVGGHYNCFIGMNAGYFNNWGEYNTFIGPSAGYKCTWGTKNVFIGYFAGYSLTSGQKNLVIGYQAGYSNVTGSRNLFLGHQAGWSEIGSDKLYIASGATDALTLIHGEFNTKLLFIKGAAAAPADAKLHNSDINFWIDEVNDQLEIKLKKSDGTVLTGNVQLA